MSVQTEQDHFHKCSRDLEIAIKERQHVYGLLRDADERVLRLKIAKTNAWDHLELAKAEGAGLFEKGAKP